MSEEENLLEKKAKKKSFVDPRAAGQPTGPAPAAPDTFVQEQTINLDDVGSRGEGQTGAESSPARRNRLPKKAGSIKNMGGKH